MTIEDVNLDNLQSKLDHSAIPIWLRALPVFLLALSLFDALGLTAGRPGIAAILIGPGYGGRIDFVQLLVGELVIQAALLGGAVFLRYKSPFAGMIQLESREQLLEMGVLRRLIARFGAPDGSEAAIARRRRLFFAAVALLAVAGAALIDPASDRLWLIPLTAAVWILVSMGLAWFAVFAISGHSGVGTLSIAAAGGVSLLFIIGTRGFAVSPESNLVALMAFAAAAASFALIVTSDPSRERILRLRTTAGAPGGLYKCEPDPLTCGPIFLKFQLDESSPLLLFAADHHSNAFTPISIDGSADPIPLHNKRVWIWNLRRLKQLVPAEIELRDHHDYVVATARVTQLLGSTALGSSKAISDEALMIAARRILDDGFADTLETELINAFHDYSDTLAPELSELQAKLAYAGIELAAFDLVPSPSKGDDSPVTRLHEEWKELALAVNSTLTKLKSGRSEALQLNSEWKRLIGERLTEGRGTERGLTADEAQQIVALLALKVTITKTEHGPAAASLKQQLSDLPAAIAGRFDEQRGWRKELILKLLSDPVTASQFADVLGKNPELLGAARPRPSDAPPREPDGKGLIDSQIPPAGTPRNRN